MSILSARMSPFSHTSTLDFTIKSLTFRDRMNPARKPLKEEVQNVQIGVAD